MKAFILAAGLGTRLGQLTDNKPKALVEVNGIPMIELTIERLKKAGITEFLVNVHHFGEQLINFINSKNSFGVDITVSDELGELLNTGGAIKKAHHFFEGHEPTLVHNVDVLADIDLDALLKTHLKSEALATLCVRNRISSRGLLFDEHMRLIGWTNTATNEFKWVDKPLANYQRLAFSGIYMISPEFTGKIPFTGSFSIIDVFLEVGIKEKIIGYKDDSETWFDLGTDEKIKLAEQHLKK